MKSTLFLNSLSCVDHAFIAPDGKLVGGSWLPDVFVTGEVIGDESVVVDFSTIKKDIKNLIDDPETGYDHKLLFFEGISQGNVSEVDGVVTIKTNHVEFVGPANAVKIAKAASPQEALRNHIEAGLKEKYPELNITVVVNVKMDRVHGLYEHNQYFFRYVHGLKSSTSWGCGNLAHGHLSFLEPIGGDDLGNRLLMNQIASQLDQVVFIYKENIIEQDEEKIIIGYDKTVCGRGPFKLTIDPRTCKFAILDTETTIEYLAEFVKTHWGEAMKSHGITTLLISEGLSKGALADLTK